MYSYIMISIILYVHVFYETNYMVCTRISWDQLLQNKRYKTVRHLSSDSTKSELVYTLSDKDFLMH
jgi:hypothetical protein